MANFGVVNRLDIVQGATSSGYKAKNGTYEVSFYNSLTLGGDHLADYTVYVSSLIKNVRENADGSIDLDYYGVNKVQVKTTQAKNISSVAVTYRLRVDTDNSGNLKEVWSKNSDLSGSFDSGIINVESLAKPLHIHINAGESYELGKTKKVLNWYADAPLADDEFNIYLGHIANFNEPLYTPCGIRHSGSFKSVNKENRYNQIRVNNQFSTIHKEIISKANTPNSGHVRVRKNNVWLQSPPYEE